MSLSKTSHNVIRQASKITRTACFAAAGTCTPLRAFPKPARVAASLNLIRRGPPIAPVGLSSHSSRTFATAPDAATGTAPAPPASKFVVSTSEEGISTISMQSKPVNSMSFDFMKELAAILRTGLRYPGAPEGENKLPVTKAVILTSSLGPKGWLFQGDAFISCLFHAHLECFHFIRCPP